MYAHECGTVQTVCSLTVPVRMTQSPKDSGKGRNELGNRANSPFDSSVDSRVPKYPEGPKEQGQEFELQGYVTGL